MECILNDGQKIAPSLERSDGGLDHLPPCWYVPYSAPERHHTEVLLPSLSSVGHSSDEHDAEYEQLCLALNSGIPNQHTSRLLYTPVTRQPVCFITLTGDAVHADIKPSLLAIQRCLEIVIDKGEWQGPTLEFITLTNEVWDNLDWDPLSLPRLAEYIHTAPVPFDFECFVMFGPYYDHSEQRWTTQVALWVTCPDPLFRNFMFSPTEQRPTSHMGLPMQYYTISFAEQSVEPTEPDFVPFWSDVMGNDSVAVGTRILVPDPDSMGMKAVTLGPSVASVLDRDDISKNWFFTTAHAFRKRDKTYHTHGNVLRNNKIIGKLIATHPDVEGVHLSIIALDPRCKVSHGIMVDVNHHRNSHCIPVKRTIAFPKSLAPSEISGNWREVFKSGSASAVTKGIIRSWGAHINPQSRLNTTQLNTEKMKLQILVGHHSSCYKRFSAFGDSGAPVFHVDTTDGVDKATLIGMVSGISENLNLTVAVPFYASETEEWVNQLMLSTQAASTPSTIANVTKRIRSFFSIFG